MPITTGLVSSSNVTFTDDVSGILGLGFPRLSTISNTVVNGTLQCCAKAEQMLMLFSPSYAVLFLFGTEWDAGLPVIRFEPDARCLGKLNFWYD